MDDVVRNAWMVGMLGEEGFEDFAATALICEGLVRFGRNDVERNRVKNGGFIIVRISGLQCCHPFLESTVIGGSVLAVFCIHC